MPASAGPLAGVRVIELPALGPVPFLGMLLADLGADVIRIARPAPGLSPYGGDDPLDRGRRVIVVDLRHARGAEIVLRLAGSAGHNINFVALTGLLGGAGQADGPPAPPASSLGDFAGGSMFLAVGVLAALLQARASGKGQVIDAAMIDGAAYLGSMTRAMAADAQESGGGSPGNGSPNYGCYRCADGRYVAVAAVEPKFWAVLVRLLGDEPENVPSPYDSTGKDRCRRYLTGAFARKTRDEWAALLEGTDACVTPVLTLAEAPGHRHNVARSGYVMAGGRAVAVPAPRFSSLPGHGVAGPSAPTGPALLAEAGYSADEIDELVTGAIVGA
jgi:alpha-methylacyl-CoA racemase